MIQPMIEAGKSSTCWSTSKTKACSMAWHNSVQWWKHHKDNTQACPPHRFPIFFYLLAQFPQITASTSFPKGQPYNIVYRMVMVGNSISDRPVGYHPKKGEKRISTIWCKGAFAEHPTIYFTLSLKRGRWRLCSENQVFSSLPDDIL